MGKGTGHLLYWLVDELVSDYFPVIEAIDDALDTLEDNIFIEPRQSLLEQIFTLKDPRCTYDVSSHPSVKY